MNNTTDTCEISTEQYIIATIYSLFSFLYCIPYTICIVIITTDAGLRNQQYYRIVANMGITDISQLIFNGMFSGIFTFACIDFTKSPTKFWINKIIGGVMNFNWVIYCLFAHLLAFNRFCHIFFPNNINSIFSQRNANLMLSMIWLYGFGWLAAYMVPDFNLLYYVEEYKWDYDEVPLSRKAWLSELISDSINAVGMVILYFCILIKLRMKMNQIENKQLTAHDKKERIVLLQAILICLLTILTLLGFFLIPQIMDNRWSNFISNLLWLCCAGGNSLIYIKLNSTINRKFQKFVSRVFMNKVFTTSEAMTINVPLNRTTTRMNKETIRSSKQVTTGC